MNESEGDPQILSRIDTLRIIHSFFPKNSPIMASAEKKLVLDGILASAGGGGVFKELENESNLLASGLIQSGMKPGNRVLLMVPYGIDFVILAFAMFKAGLVSVLIDPGLGKINVLKCIKQIQPQGMIAISLAHAIRKLLPATFKSIEHNVTVGKRWFWGGTTLRQLQDSRQTGFKIAPMEEDDAAAILFTSGSTGPAKGVLYTHGIFNHQVRVLQEQFNIQNDEIKLA